MSEEATPTASSADSCANCGAPLVEEFCTRCGQSREDIRRPVWSLATDTFDGLFAWDGRLFTTFRRLFTRPGRVARDYIDGRRQSYTPPVRLYLIVSLIFFAVMTVSGIRIVAVEIGVDDTGQPGVVVTMFQRPREGEVELLTAEEQEQVLAFAEGANIDGRWREIAIEAMNHPGAVEDSASAAASQAMILMVVIFALLSGIFHPRRRIIEHAVYALYFHAALLLPLAGVLLAGIFVPLPAWALIGLAAGLVLGLNALVALHDRGFYASSWFGAILRSILICMAYVTSAVFVAMGLIFVAAL